MGETFSLLLNSATDEELEKDVDSRIYHLQLVGEQIDKFRADLTKIKNELSCQLDKCKEHSIEMDITNGELKEASANIKVLEATITALNTQLTVNEEEKKTMAANIIEIGQKLETNIVLCKSLNNTMETIKEEHERMKVSFKAEINGLKDDATKYAQELSRNQQLEERIEKMEMERNRAEVDLVTERKIRVRVQNECVLANEKKELENELLEERKSKGLIEARLNEEQQNVAYIQSELETEKQKSKKLDENIVDLKREKDLIMFEADKKTNQLNSQLSKLSVELKSTAEAMEKLKNDFNEETHTKEVLEKERNSLRDTNKQLGVQIKRLMSNNEAIAEEKERYNKMHKEDIAQQAEKWKLLMENKLKIQEDENKRLKSNNDKLKSLVENEKIEKEMWEKIFNKLKEDAKILHQKYEKLKEENAILKISLGGKNQDEILILKQEFAKARTENKVLNDQLSFADTKLREMNKHGVDHRNCATLPRESYSSLPGPSRESCGACKTSNLSKVTRHTCQSTSGL